MLKFRNSVLELIAKGEPLKDILDRRCTGAERHFASASFTVLSVDPAGMIHPISAPAFPHTYVEALDGLLVGPDVGSCGSAIYHNRQIGVADIETDPRWSSFKSLALPLGYKACCSLPIRDEGGRLAGALAVYFTEKRLPDATEQHALEVCAELCELAFARQERTLEQERRATIDALTGLPNRAAFDEALTQLRCEFPGSWALFVIDIDNLKVTNDTFGHDAGDSLIRAIGRRIAGAIAPDTVFRTGGDEYTVIIQNDESLKDLYRTAQIVFQAISGPVEHDRHTFLPRATMGGAALSPADVKPANVRRNADFALYHAKETQPGGFVRYWPGIGTRMVYRRDVIRDVIEALEEDRIELRYQPVVRLDNGLINGFEALSCLKNRSGRVLPASLFHEAFADARVSAELTRRVLEGTARDLRKWFDEGLPLAHVGVNVTSADFYFGNLLEKIGTAFAARDVPLRHLFVEVTEDAYLGQRDQVVASGIRDLRMAGIGVALDDFGTGFAALSHLLTVPIDSIKIDRSFVRRLSPDHPSTAIVRGIIQIARDLGKNLIAEGVETFDQLTLLKEMGCAMVQGYIFSRPVSFREATRLLRKHGRDIPGAVPILPREVKPAPEPAIERRRVA